MSETGPKIENQEELKKKILLVDDDETIIYVVRIMLEEVLGYEVITAGNGKELLDKLNSGEKFHAVITDNNMPEINGIDALEQIRKNPQFEKLPVILHTGGGNYELEKRVEKLGGKYLEKPYSSDTLKSVLDEICK